MIVGGLALGLRDEDPAAALTGVAAGAVATAPPIAFIAWLLAGSCRLVVLCALVASVPRRHLAG
jgi:hypothetical protein